MASIVMIEVTLRRYFSFPWRCAFDRHPPHARHPGLAITSPIYVIIFLGFLLTRSGLFARPDMRIFGRFVVNLALPALLFRSLAQRQISDVLNGSYLLAGLAVSVLGWQLPAPVVRTVELLATSSSALALFVIGGTLVGLPGHLCDLGPRPKPTDRRISAPWHCW